MHSAFGQLTVTEDFVEGASRKSVEKVKTQRVGSAAASNRKTSMDLKVQPGNGAEANIKEDYDFTRLANLVAEEKSDSGSPSPRRPSKDPTIVQDDALATDVRQARNLQTESGPTWNGAAGKRRED